MRGCGLEVEASAERPNAEYTWYKLNEWMQVEVLQEFGAFMEEQPWFRFPFFAHLRGACRPPRRPCSRISYSPLLGCLAAWLLGCSRPPSLPPSRPRELLPTPPLPPLQPSPPRGSGRWQFTSRCCCGSSPSSSRNWARAKRGSPSRSSPTRRSVVKRLGPSWGHPGRATAP